MGEKMNESIPAKLPVWKGWTVDLRLRQFRKVGYDENHSPLGIEMWDFDSQQGKDIFYDYCQDKYDYHMECGSDYQRTQMQIEEGELDDEMLDYLAKEIVKELGE